MFRSSIRYARISPRKVRPLADLIRGRLADDALEILRYQPQRGARLLEKCLKAALGSAANPEENEGRTFRPGSLIVDDVRVDGGPMFRRVRPRARGMAHFIKKRTSHIHVGLETVES